jgi:competence protein ComEC
VALVAVLVAERLVAHLVTRGMIDPGASSMAGVLLLMGTASLVAFLFASRPHVHVGGPLQLVAVALFAASCGTVASLAAQASRLSAASALASRPVSTLELAIVSDPTPTTSGFLCRARVEGEGVPPAQVWVSGSDELVMGERLRCVGRFGVVGPDDRGISSAMRGICGSVSVTHVLSHEQPSGAIGLVSELRGRAIRMLDPTSSDERALMAGCLVGWRQGLVSRGIDDLFSGVGLAHLIAVSGSHLAFVTQIASIMMSRGRARPLTRAVVALSLSAAFVVLCGMPLSAIRAWCMAAASVVGRTSGRRAHALSAVSLVGVAFCLLDATVACELGFLLSMTSVVGLCLFTRYASCLLSLLAPVRVPWSLARRVPSRVRARLRRLSLTARDALSSAIVAMLVTMPLCAQAFSSVPVVGPLANVVCAPVFLVAVTFGLLAVCLAWVPVVGQLLLGLAQVPFGLLAWLARSLSTLPFSCVPLDVPGWAPAAGLLLASVFLLLWPTPSRRDLGSCLLAGSLVLGCVLARWTFLAPARVVVMDVGQGDAILVQDGAHAVLVDTGPDASVVEALARSHVLRLDAVVLTHLHDDHVGGLDDLVGAVDVGRVLVCRGVEGNLPDAVRHATEELSAGEQVEELDQGDRLVVGRFVLEVVWPDAPVVGDDNADSICLSTSFRDGGRTMSALLMGDAEADELRQVIDEGLVGDIDLLKLGHHGSAVSLTVGEAGLLDPEVAVASAGESNRYGHPTQECIEVIKAVGAIFLCTIDSGDVCSEPGRDGIRVTTQRIGEADRSLLM